MGIVKTCKTIKSYYVKIRSFISPPPPPKPNEANLTFTTYLLKVDITSPGWQKATIAVLRSNKGVRSFQMTQNGEIIVTGTADLNLLFKMLKKAENSTELIGVKSGLCSSNLFINGSEADSYVYAGGEGPFGVNKVVPRQRMAFPIIRGSSYNLPPQYSDPYFEPVELPSHTYPPYSSSSMPPLNYGY